MRCFPVDKTKRIRRKEINIPTRVCLDWYTDQVCNEITALMWAWI